MFAIDFKKNLAYALKDLVSAKIIGLLILQFFLLILIFILYSWSFTNAITSRFENLLTNFELFVSITAALEKIYLGFVLDLFLTISALLIVFILANITTQVLVAIFFESVIIKTVAQRRFPNLQVQQNRPSTIQIIYISLRQVSVWLFLLVLGLPLLILTPVYTLWVFFVTAYYLKNSMPYAILTEFADTEEIKSTLQKHNAAFWSVGLGCMGITIIPLIGFFAPTLSLLWFAHASLEGLEQERKHFKSI